MFWSLMTIIRGIYLYLTMVVFLLKQHVIERHAALRHAATSPNLYNDVILPSVLT